MKFTVARLILCWIVVCTVAAGCGPGNEAKLRDGVAYAKAALQQVGVNPFVTAGYQGYIRNGKGPSAYIKDTLPKKNPPFESFEDNKPTHPWTVVIRTGASNEVSIEGYGLDMKKPIVVEYVTLKLPEE